MITFLLLYTLILIKYYIFRIITRDIVYNDGGREMLQGRLNLV
jgi:hypothetical protein